MSAAARRRLATLALTLLVPTWSRAAALPDAVVFGPGMLAPKLRGEGPFRSAASKQGEPLTGTVSLRVCIDTKGQVRAAEVVSSPDPRLNKGAVKTALGRDYDPATKDGKPIAVWWHTDLFVRPPMTEADLDATCDAAMANDAGPLEHDAVDVLPAIMSYNDPELARSQGRADPRGSVALRCVVDACGRMGRCSVLRTSGDNFTAAAVGHAISRRYAPALREGKPVSVYLNFTMEWRR